MKKFISMALAVVMALSLCTFIAAPKADAAFDDSDQLSSKYAIQATEVIQKIEVMDGYDDNTFRPSAGLTRQAAAKIICNMILGPTTAKALPTSANPFPDVLAGNQFSGYISYCVQQGIISGYADGTFRGGDPLSGYAYLKMLLGALGYDQKEEGFVGDNWKVNVAKIALGIGLNKGIDGELDGTTQVTREEAAIYAFNTLQADMVEYESKNTLEINGVKVTMGGSNAVPQTWNTSSTSNDYINNRKSDGQNQRPIVQFAERYFDKLRREPNVWDTYTQDDFGRPSIRWFWKGVEIGTYSRDADYRFVGNAKVNTIYEGLGMTSGDETANLYINSSIPNNERLKVTRSNDKDLDHSSNLLKDGTGKSSNIYGDGTHYVDRIGDGTLIECFRNDANNHVDVCVISVYGGKVNAVRGATTKKDAYVTIDVGMGVTVNNGADHLDDHPRRPDTIINANNNEFETEDFEEDDVVAYTYSDSAEEIKSMYLMSSESGVLQSRIQGKSIRLDDTTYAFGKEYTFNDIPNYESGLSNKSSYVIYMFNWASVPAYEALDDDEYTLWIEEDEFAVDQYVLIERITIETTVNNTTTKTASVIGNAETTAQDLARNSNVLQIGYNQSKNPVGNSTWDAQAQLRFSNGSRRTVTLDDSKNYRTDSGRDAAAIRAVYANVDANGNPVADAAGEDGRYGTADDVYSYVGGPAPRRGSLVDVANNNNYATTGDGKGNWVAEPFTAGHVVRCTSTSSGYKLHSIDSRQFFVVTDFALNGKAFLTKEFVGGRGSANAAEPVAYSTTTGRAVQYSRTGRNQAQIVADSETYFVIDDVVNGSWKTYVGIKNAPDVSKNAYNTTAYIYHRNGVAKLIFITNGTVTNSANDIVFLAANSTSNLITGTDIDEYYTIEAVEKNEIKTLMVKRGTTLHSKYLNFTPGTGRDNEENCVILNNINYDSNDLITTGNWNSDTDLDAFKGQGIRRVNSEEVRVDTRDSNILRDLSENVRVYFVDGDDIEEIEVDEIVNDTMDMVYYVMDDGEITYLFIVDYEVEAAASSDTTRVYANGEMELLDPNGNRVRYIYHYLSGSSASGEAAMKKALQNVAGSANTVATISQEDNTFVFELDGTRYTVTRQQDAHRVVEGTIPGVTDHVDGDGIDPIGATISNVYLSSKLYYADNAGFVSTDVNHFLADSPVTLTVVPTVSTDIVTVTVTTTSGSTFTVDGAAVEDRTDGAQSFTFTVPTLGFTTNVSAAPAG